VNHLALNLKIPVTCKVRVFKNDEDTINMCKRLEKAGCAILTGKKFLLFFIIF